eukprot:scaffold31468_cov35-Tisochrysis_lutea.AAC.1
MHPARHIRSRSRKVGARLSADARVCNLFLGLVGGWARTRCSGVPLLLAHHRGMQQSGLEQNELSSFHRCELCQARGGQA